MSTAVAVPTAALPSSVERQMSPRHQFTTITQSASSSSAKNGPPAAGEPAAKRARSNGSPDSVVMTDRPSSNGQTTPPSGSRNHPPPAIKVKKEPGSPSLASSRPRPKRLDLSSSNSSRGGQNTGRPSAPLTSRESAGLVVHDVGLACLSPGFQTNDPGMREQLQRSLDVRDQQRMIIEARNKGLKPGSSNDASDGPRTQDNTLFGAPTGIRTPTTSRRKGPPPGLSISAPSAAQFANDRVVQSAPLHQTFTGLRPGEYPHSRHAQHGPSALSQTSHIHHVPATQTNNRLPPISDVFAHDRLDAPRGSYPSAPSPSHQSSNGQHPIPSPSFPPPSFGARSREFRSAEEAVHGLSGGRDDLMPKVVHYGGVQPPTPPSPMPTGSGAQQSAHHTHHHASAHQTYPPASTSTAAPHDVIGRTASMNGRRRGRDEFERDNASPPFPPPPPPSFGSSQQQQQQGGHPSTMSFRAAADHKRPTIAVRGDGNVREDDWRSGMSGNEKREEFLRLCERAWDLFHS